MLRHMHGSLIFFCRARDFVSRVKPTAVTTSLHQVRKKKLYLSLWHHAVLVLVLLVLILVVIVVVVVVVLLLLFSLLSLTTFCYSSHLPNLRWLTLENNPLDINDLSRDLLVQPDLCIFVESNKTHRIADNLYLGPQKGGKCHTTTIFEATKRKTKKNN